MRRVQYVSQKSVKEYDVARLTDREQDDFIKDVGDTMLREMRERVKDCPPLQEAVTFWVTGPHSDPLQGIIHVHNISAWFDLDAMAADAPFRVEYLAQEQNVAEAPIAGRIVTTDD